MLNGKLYAIYDPYLCQQVLRAKLASFDPFQEEFAQKVFGLSQATYDKIRLNPQIFPDFTDAIHQSFQTDSLAKMNMRWLTDFAAKMRALTTFMVNEDAELFVLMRLAEDATLLTESAMK